MKCKADSENLDVSSATRLNDCFDVNEVFAEALKHFGGFWVREPLLVVRAQRLRVFLRISGDAGDEVRLLQ
jgi:hypothetical protein